MDPVTEAKPLDPKPAGRWKYRKSSGVCFLWLDEERVRGQVESENDARAIVDAMNGAEPSEGAQAPLFAEEPKS